MAKAVDHTQPSPPCPINLVAPKAEEEECGMTPPSSDEGSSPPKMSSDTVVPAPAPPVPSSPPLAAAHALKKKTQSLKRSITLPRNPFASSSGGAGALPPGHHAPNNKSDTLGSTGSSNHSGGGAHKKSKLYNPGANGRHKDLEHSNYVRQFFSRVVSQLHKHRYSTSSPSKYEEERLQEWKKRLENGRVPGVMGIRNHGNTCFINAILQCLSYTDILAEYFVLDQYKSDLRRKRRIANLTTFHKRAGAGNKGEVTEQLATLLKSLWSLQYDPEISIRFKSLVDKHASQYKGGSQHDAQEFLLWLLDRVHEDLNTATKRRYKLPASSPAPAAAASASAKSGAATNGVPDQPTIRSDETLAAESLANYMRCNNSFVMDVFQAQFRSSLTCPTCQRQSNTFDPFLCVSLPIPQKQLLPVFVTVLYIDQTPRQVKLGITANLHETVGELRSVLAKDTGIEADQMLLIEIDKLGFQRTLRDQQPVTVIKEAKGPLYCIEVPQHRLSSEDDGAFVILTWVNVLKEGPIEKRFGSPYAIQVSRETLYEDLQKLLLKEMSPILHDDILISAQKVPLFKIRVLDGFDDAAAATYLDSQVDLPMYTEAVEQAINLCTVEASGGPAHVKLILEWDAPAKSQIVNDDRDVIEEHASVKEVQKAPEEATSVTLQECFSLYTSAEKLGQGDAWLCPACNRKQEVVKRMGLWSVPDVLVIHLKRFRQSATASGANKLTTLVEFPLENFDMSPNVTKGKSRSESAATGAAVNGASFTPSTAAAASNDPGTAIKMLNNVLSPWRHPKRFHIAANHPQDVDDDEDYAYELYAVCNHHGTDLQGGHYTAVCKNPTDGQWYNFDDMHTKSISEADVVTNDAYILFFQRQSISSSSSSSSSSDSSKLDNHWVFRMPDFSYKKKSASTTATTTTTTTTTSASKQTTTKTTTVSKSPCPASKVVEKSKPENVTSNVSSGNKRNGSFNRNSEKYATMPAKRTSEIVTCSDHECQSDVEHGDNDSDDDEEEEEDDCEGPEEEKMTNTTEASKREDDGISRPIDKNDVD